MSDSWTPGPKPLCHRHPTGPHPSGLLWTPWTPDKGDSTNSDFALGSLAHRLEVELGLQQEGVGLLDVVAQRGTRNLDLVGDLVQLVERLADRRLDAPPVLRLAAGAHPPVLQLLELGALVVETVRTRLGLPIGERRLPQLARLVLAHHEGRHVERA